MGMLVVPLLLVTLTAPAKTATQKLADFSRFSEAINTEVALIDAGGVMREGLLTAATADAVTMKFASGDRSFARADVASAERIRDSTRDGLIKGMVFGAVTGLFASQGLSTPAQGIAAWAGSIAFYGSIGWAIDAAQKHRQTIYLAPAATPAPKKPALGVAVRF